VNGREALLWGAVLVLLVALFAWGRISGERSSAVPLPAGTTSTKGPDAGPPAPQVATDTSSLAPSPARDALEPAPAALAPVLRMRVRSAASYASNAPPVANIAFQVFAKRELPGPPMQDSSRAPIPLAPGDPPVYSGRTDAEGEARFELDARRLHPREGELAPVLVRVVEPGFQQRVGSLWAAKDEPGVLACTVMAIPGATARGQVVDPQGVPVGADVRLYGWGQGQLDNLAVAERLAGGGFELHLGESVTDGQLLAEAGPHGTGALRDVALPLEDPPQDLRIVLHGEGSLAVRIEDTGGAPAAGVDVLVFLASLDDERGSFVAREPDSSLRRAEGLGRTWVTGQTDSAGRLDARGLRPDAYVVRASTGQGTVSGYPLLLTPQPVSADGRELVLRLAHPSLLVRLLDSEGRPWPGPAPEPESRRARKEREARWPVQPVARAFACEARAGEPCAAGEELAGKFLADGEVVFEVEDGARYLVLAQGPGFDGVPREVEVPEGSGPVVVELRARELGEPGTLALRVVHDGAELVGGYGGTTFELRLESLELATPLLRLDSEGRAPFLLCAPAGRYRAVVAGRASTNSHHGTLTGPRSLGEATAEVVLVAGVTQELTLALDQGARLEVTLAGEIDATDLAAARARAPAIESAAEYAELAREAELFLVDPGRPREPVVHVIQGGIMGAFLRRTWRLGTTEVSECLPSGRHRLVARLPGGREARAEVELLPGTTSAVKLVF